MKRATMTLPDDLEKAVDDYRQAQENPPALTVVVQAALREYLAERGFMRSHRPLRLRPVGRSQGSGRGNASIEHDAYLAGIKK
jgi:hypothetical protein